MTAPTTEAGTAFFIQSGRSPLWFLRTATPPLAPARRAGLHWLLRLATAGGLIGHGAYGAVMAKPGWYPFLAQLGLDRAADAASLVWWSGGFEMLLGVLALMLPVRALPM